MFNLSPRKDIRGFTLLEMLIVVGLIGIIVAITLPALNSLGQGTKLATSGNILVNLVSLARQQAMSKNSVTALVMLGKNGTPEDYRAFTVLEYVGDRGWAQVSKWETLPEGIVVDKTDPVTCSFLTNSPDLKKTPRTVSGTVALYKSTPLEASTQYFARIFTPSGGLMNAELPAQIRLVEGNMVSEQVVYTHRKSGGAANFYDIAIIGATGQAKAGRP